MIYIRLNGSDFLKQDVHKLYPQHEKLVQISLIEAGKKLLSTFDSNLSDYTAKQFRVSILMIIVSFITLVSHLTSSPS